MELLHVVVIQLGIIIGILVGRTLAGK